MGIFLPLKWNGLSLCSVLRWILLFKKPEYKRVLYYVYYSHNKQALFCCYLLGHCFWLCVLCSGIGWFPALCQHKKAFQVTMAPNHTMTALRIYGRFHYFLLFVPSRMSSQATSLSVWGSRWRGSHGDKQTESGRRGEDGAPSSSPSLHVSFSQQASPGISASFSADAKRLVAIGLPTSSQHNGRFLMGCCAYTHCVTSLLL